MTRLTRRELLLRSAQFAPAIVLPQLVLAACSDDKTTTTTSNTPPTTGQAKATKTQVLVGFGTGNAPEQTPPQEALATKYKAARPG